ncbi:hypothetical protein CXG81DRAFT_21016 [Caulochytrium protostelioides]|uniref:Uncharacterized protein n=1 Tax=Caulochytrium protostelioides TaxID=1555241 RepID=A0A4P9X165_9FUNG|nr:hypothetical protein CXG81DRAFT_21016 [Caulochytrium protostelioides]|eukprot:RKO98822.1 hypothetical protein CXG81DRAFT_21016 [Caulochytrium protostelioides]
MGAAPSAAPRTPAADSTLVADLLDLHLPTRAHDVNHLLRQRRQSAAPKDKTVAAARPTTAAAAVAAAPAPTTAAPAPATAAAPAVAASPAAPPATLTASETPPSAASAAPSSSSFTDTLMATTGKNTLIVIGVIVVVVLLSCSGWIMTRFRQASKQRAARDRYWATRVPTVTREARAQRDAELAAAFMEKKRLMHDSQAHHHHHQQTQAHVLPADHPRHPSPAMPALYSYAPAGMGDAAADAARHHHRRHHGGGGGYSDGVGYSDGGAALYATPYGITAGGGAFSAFMAPTAAPVYGEPGRGAAHGSASGASTLAPPPRAGLQVRNDPDAMLSADARDGSPPYPPSSVDAAAAAVASAAAAAAGTSTAPAMNYPHDPYASP